MTISSFIRVLAPPGGKTSINLYAGEEAPVGSSAKQVNPCQAARNKSSVFTSEGGSNSKPAQQHVIAQEKRGKSSVFADPEPLKPVKNVKTDNVVLKEEAPKQEPLHTSVQVINPPGGKSQISFG